MKHKALTISAAVLAAAAAASAGGYYAFMHDNDPIRRAAQLSASGDVRGAQLELRNAVRSQPDNAQAHVLLAQTQLRLADPVAAEKELHAARSLGADEWAVIPLLAQAYIAQGKFKQALEETPDAAPKPELLAKCLMLRSIAQAGLDDVQAASASLAAAEQALPGDADVLLTAARLAFAQKDLDLALRKVEAAQQARPDQAEAFLLESRIFAARGSKAEAMAAINTAVALAPKAAPLKLERANQYLADGQDANALVDLKAVLAANPREAGAIYLNGVLLLRAGKPAEAQAELQKLGPAIERFPRGLYFAAVAAAYVGQAGTAAELAARYVNQAPSDPEGAILLARIELEAKRPLDAASALRKAVADGHDELRTLALLSQAYLAAGNRPDAVAALRQASQAAPDNVEILTRLASLQMQSGQPEAAAAALEKSVKLSPAQPNAGEALVAAAMTAGDLDRAETALNELRSQQGDSETVGILTGMLKLARLDIDGARAAFAQTLQRHPDSLSAKVNLAKVLALQGNDDQSKTLFQEALEKNPANPQALTALVQLFANAKQWPEAIKAVQAARAAAPDNAGLTAMLSDVYIRAGEPGRAVTLLQNLSGKPGAPPQLALALAQAAAGDLDGAKSAYRQILEADPRDLAARQAQVELLLRTKDAAGAKAALKDALAQWPGNLGIMSSLVSIEAQTAGEAAGLGLAASLRNDPANLPNSALLKGDELMRTQRFAEAVKAYQTEYQLRQTTPLALQLAKAEAAQGHDDAAAGVLRDQLAREPGDPDAAQMLAVLDMKAKRYDAAETRLQTVLAKQPNNVIAMNNLAWVYQQKGDSRARNLAQRAYLHAPTPDTADTLGWIMVGQGDAKRALPLLEQSSQQRPDDSTLKYHLAVALNDTGRKREAAALLQPIVDGAGDFADKPAARKLLQQLAKES